MLCAFVRTALRLCAGHALTAVMPLKGEGMHWLITCHSFTDPWPRTLSFFICSKYKLFLLEKKVE